ncbi:MAG: hypothetical protein HC854_12875 [Flavobacterium sp.]|nr:hypothetical protein [Flavobacterium sp.]
MVFLLILSLFSTKSDADLLIIPTSNSLNNSNLSQLIQSNNDNAVQIEPQII